MKLCNVNFLFFNIRYSLMQRVYSVETYVSKKLYEEYGRKFIIRFADVSLPLKSNMSESWRTSLLITSLTYGKLRYKYHMRNDKVVYLCVSLGTISISSGGTEDSHGNPRSAWSVSRQMCYQGPTEHNSEVFAFRGNCGVSGVRNPIVRYLSTRRRDVRSCKTQVLMSVL